MGYRIEEQENVKTCCGFGGPLPQPANRLCKFSKIPPNNAHGEGGAHLTLNGCRYVWKNTRKRKLSESCPIPTPTDAAPQFPDKFTPYKTITVAKEETSAKQCHNTKTAENWYSFINSLYLKMIVHLINFLDVLLFCSYLWSSYSLLHDPNWFYWLIGCHSSFKWCLYCAGVWSGTHADFHIGFCDIRCDRPQQGYGRIWGTAGHRDLCVHLSHAWGKEQLQHAMS